MKIIAQIPVEKVRLSPVAITFRFQEMEVQVLRVIRTPATRYPHLNSWFYQADIIPPPNAALEGMYSALIGTARVNINRVRNPKWKPPVFTDKYIFEVPNK